ncbi:MAG: tetratricopeptide repeat protein [Verrucomicrobiota bacterium]
MKWFFYAVLALMVAGNWAWFSHSGKEIAALEQKVETMRENNEDEGEISKVATEANGKEGSRTFQGLLLAFMSAGLGGMVFVFELLPLMAQKLTHSVYDSGERVEKDVMHDARALLAQGEYEGAIIGFRAAAAKDPDNRMPWNEIAKIQRDHLGDPAAAAATLTEALELKSWPDEDTAFLLFRLADTYHDGVGNSASAIAVLNQVVQLFPDTRHSANAAHRIEQWSAAPVETKGTAAIREARSARKTLEEEEAEFLAKMRAREADEASDS